MKDASESLVHGKQAEKKEKSTKTNKTALRRSVARLPEYEADQSERFKKGPLLTLEESWQLHLAHMNENKESK